MEAIISKLSDPRRHERTLASTVTALIAAAGQGRERFGALLAEAETKGHWAGHNTEKAGARHIEQWREILPILESARKEADGIIAMLEEGRDARAAWQKASAAADRVDAARREAADRDAGQADAEAREAERRAQEASGARAEARERERIAALSPAEAEAEKRLAQLGARGR